MNHISITAGLGHGAERNTGPVPAGTRAADLRARRTFARGGPYSSRVVPGSSRLTSAWLGVAATDIILVIRARPASFRMASWMA